MYTDWSDKRWVFLVLVGVVLTVGVIGAVPSEQVLIVERPDTGETVVLEPVGTGSVVALEYMHSVEKTRVYDEYTVNGTTLDNSRMEFESYGWGLPTGANVTLEEGVFVFDPDRSYDEIRVKPGRVANHTLIVDDHRYDLVERADANSVIIRVSRQSLIPRLLESLSDV